MLSSPWFGLLECQLISLLYVAPFYLLRTSRLPRNHPRTVLMRMACTTAVGCVAWLPLYFALQHQDPTAAQPATTLHYLGLRSHSLVLAILLPLALTGTLLSGPAFILLHDYFYEHHKTLLGERPLLAARDLLVAPLTEEWVFRACMAPLLLLQGWSMRSAVLLTPLFFGTAHLHHLHDLVAHQRYPLKQALVQVLFQFTYTTAFGWYATLLLLRTGHLVAPLVAHVVCNWIGVPQLNRVKDHPMAHGIINFLVGGALFFFCMFQHLTDPEFYGNALYPKYMRSSLW